MDRGRGGASGVRSKLAEQNLQWLQRIAQPSLRAPFTVVAHTDVVLYSIPLPRLLEIMGTDIALLRQFFES
jgi:CRP-like cAMP-binding protein